MTAKSSRDKISQFQLLFGGVVLLQLASLVIYTAFGLFISYSYWFDELFSAVAASEPLENHLTIYISEPHPPLYQILLSGWVYVWGNGEVATRLLSAFFVFSIGFAIVYFSRNFGRNLALLFVVFLLSNYMVFLYAQETRSYGMLLALSTWTLILFACREKRFIFPVLVAMGLTHFFGAMVSLLILSWLIIESRKDWALLRRCALTSGIILAWPILYVVFGSASEIAGGNFWIQTSPAGSLLDFLRAAVPAPMAAVQNIDQYMGGGQLKNIILSLFLIFIAALFGLLRIAVAQEFVLTIKVIFILVMCAISVVLISMHTPISHVRYFVVIVPHAALLVAVLTFLALRIGTVRYGAIFFILAIAVLSQYHIFTVMSNRFKPVQDWKAAAQTAEIVASENPGIDIFLYVDKYAIRRRFIRPDGFYERVKGYYFSVDTEYSPVMIHDVPDVPRGSIIYFGQQRSTSDIAGQCDNDILQALRRNGIRYSAFFAEQSWRCMNGFVLLE